MKRADQVLALGNVHAGLAANRRIDHRQQGRRNLHEPDAAHISRRGKSREVSDHPATERNRKVRAGEAQRGESAHQLRVGLERLRLLARREDDALDLQARVLDLPDNHIAVKPVDIRVCHQRRLPRFRKVGLPIKFKRHIHGIHSHRGFMINSSGLEHQQAVRFEDYRRILWPVHRDPARRIVRQ